MLAILLSVQRPAFVPEEPWVDIARSNRFIILGILIISTVFSLVWPEDARTIARQKLAASLQAIARLLNIRGGSESNPEREQLELEIASHLAEANASQEQAAFEALTHSPAANASGIIRNGFVALSERSAPLTDHERFGIHQSPKSWIAFSARGRARRGRGVEQRCRF
jgi:fusaric acid resistance family protein